MGKTLLNPRMDGVFKLIFGNIHNMDILGSFLRAVLDVSPEDLGKLIILDPFLRTERIDGKVSIPDILAASENGMIIIVEMQCKKYPDMEKRIMHYISNAYLNQIQEGQSYSDLKKVVAIVIMNYIYLRNQTILH